MNTGAMVCNANGSGTVCNVQPGLPSAEVCDGIDNNCNGLVDEGVMNAYYRDADADGYGNSSVMVQACTAPAGYTSNNTDCNDSDSSMNPGNAEVCDGKDNNCNGQVDEGFANTDGDAQADCVDLDDDNDGLPDSAEISIYGTDPRNPDTDGDTVLDGNDNAPLIYNPDQRDTDGDGVGDVADAYPLNPLLSQPDPSVPVTDASTNVGATGGAISTTDGSLEMQIPSGAVTTDTTITISKAASGQGDVVVDTGHGRGKIVSTYNLYPDGQTFNGPVTLVFHYTDQPNEEKLRVYWYNPQTLSYEMMTPYVLDTVLNTITVQVMHFSTYAAIELLDITPPVISAAVNPPANITGWHNSDVTVSFICSDTESGIAVCPSPAIVNTEGAGRVITGIAVDNAGNSASASVTIALDKTAPVISGTPSNMTLEATVPSGAVATYISPTATDIVAGAVSVTCAPASGSTFAVGHTTVNCSASDTHGNGAQSFFDVFVADTTAPVISGTPSNMTVEATGSTGAVATYSIPTANDIVDGVVAVNCAPASGSTFALGTTRVTCFASDSHGNSVQSFFDVFVADTTAPVIIGTPSNMTVEATGSTGAVVMYAIPTASDIVDGAVTVACTPASGSTFALGHTTVTCSAADSHGNSVQSFFDVFVADTIAPVITPPADVVIEATGLQTLVSIGTATATDAVGVVSLTNDAFATYPLGSHVITWTATDSAGNTGTAIQRVTVIDTVPPSITVTQNLPANGNGWNNSEVILSFNCSDNNSSGIASCSAPVTVSNEGANQVITGSAVDYAGNSTATTASVNLDKTSPTLTMPTLATGYAYRQSLTLIFNAQDSLSGIENVTAKLNGIPVNSGDVITLNLTGQNVFTLTAVDKAGNVSEQGITFNVLNTPPAAEAGADLSLICIEMSCPAILDGSGSTDPNSTTGTQDDIVSYEWYENYTGNNSGTPIATGKIVSLDLPLGEHLITLVVTDTAGATGQETIKVSINPARLSLLEVTKTEVEWSKDSAKPDKVKIHGKVAMPAGKDFYLVNPAGETVIGISSNAGVLNQAVTFQAKGEHGSKWEYKASTSGNGISEYKIDWDGARFDYNKDIRIKSNHLGQNSTSLEIDRNNITEPVTITVADVTIRIDATGAAVVEPSTVPLDMDDDGEIEVDLPFALAQNTIINVAYGTVSSQIKVGDYYSAAVGKFEITGQFKSSGLNGTSRPATLDLGVTMGNQKFPASFKIVDGAWNELKAVQWKYKK